MLREQLNLTSDAAVQRWLKSQGATLHHAADGVSLEMVPSPLHNNVPHTGGASILRSWDYSKGAPMDYVKANRIAAGGRYLGAAG
ncbi:HNH endonuclease, partial [Roseateles sp. P5_E11]